VKKTPFSSLSEQEEMARWTSSTDVLADLNTLSKFSAECDCKRDSPFVPYSSYGRGSSIDNKKLTGLPSPLLNTVLLIKRVHIIEVSVSTLGIQIV
jgi:hypothetical protein